jgi:uroporphyrinogen-III synthase
MSGAGAVIRVAITTDRFDDAAVSYAAVGLEPVSVPCIEVEPSPANRLVEARVASSRADLLVVTSPRAVSILWPAGGMPAVDAVVVGEKTGDAVAGAGGRVILVGDGGLSRLVDLAGSRFEGKRVVIVRAAGTEAAALTHLRRSAPWLDEHVVYDSKPVAPDATAVDAVGFASPSSVVGWALARGFDDLVVGAIGRTTSAAVARHRVPDVVAKQPSHGALAEAIAEHMELRV